MSACAKPGCQRSEHACLTGHVRRPKLGESDAAARPIPRTGGRQRHVLIKLEKGASYSGGDQATLTTIPGAHNARYWLRCLYNRCPIWILNRRRQMTITS
jgi:hypothetical protein